MPQSQLRFYPKAKIIFILGLAVSLSHVAFWGTSPYFLLNALFVSSSVLTGGLAFYAFYKSVNGAKYAIYILSLISVLSLAGVLQVALSQKIVLVSSTLLCLGTLSVLNLYRDEALEYFKTPGLSRRWKVSYIIVLAVVMAVTATAFVFQAKMKLDSQRMAVEMESSLIEGGTVNPNVLAGSKDKYSHQDLSEEQLHSFCSCVSLNLEHMLKNSNPVDMNISGIMAKSMALGDLCMKKVSK